MRKNVTLTIAQLLLIFSLLLSLCSCAKHEAPPAPAPQPTSAVMNDFIIVPGERAGIFRLGETVESLENLIGKGMIIPREEFQIYSFKDWMVDVCVKKDQILMILIMNPRFATKEGIRIGMDVTPVVRTYGRKYDYEKTNSSDVDYIIQYWDSGISFSVKKETIVKIKVFDQKLAIKQLKE